MKGTSWVTISGLLAIYAISMTVVHFANGNKTTSSKEVKSHLIPKKQSDEYIQRFKENKGHLMQFNIADAEMFPAEVFKLMLEQKNVEGIKIYNGINEKGELVLVMNPYDSQKKDLAIHPNNSIFIPGIPTANAASSDGYSIEMGQRCPPWCE